MTTVIDQHEDRGENRNENRNGNQQPTGPAPATAATPAPERHVPVVVPLKHWARWTLSAVVVFLLGAPLALARLSTSALLGLSLHQAAYSAEIIRGGLLSVDAGQLEAAKALGIPRGLRFFRIVLPQAARAILPNAFNEVIGLLKGTSVVFIVALPELFYTVQVIYNRTSQVIPLLLVAAVWYTIFTTVLSIGQYYLERFFARGSARELPPTPIQRARRALGRALARRPRRHERTSP